MLRKDRLLKENYEDISEEIIEQCKKGSIKHIEFLRDWLYGKVKDEIEHSGGVKIVEIPTRLIGAPRANLNKGQIRFM